MKYLQNNIKLSINQFSPNISNAKVINNRNNLKSLISYLKYKGISTAMQMEVRTFIEEFTEVQDEEDIKIDERTLISNLSQKLKEHYIKIGIILDMCKI